MKNDLKKGPPPIPKDALQAPPDHLRPTPWDSEVVSSAPKPVTQSPFGGANWLNHPAYPLVKPEHAADLEQHAAINEFGMKMPRAKAEAEAYGAYKKRQHTEAAAHHLAGMKAAHAAGNNEAARNHGLMYNLHSQAIGHEPVGPAHPDVIAHLQGNTPKVYKFKPHHGDQLALNPAKIAPQAAASSEAPKAPGIVSSAPGPMLGKNERNALYVIWQASQALLKGETAQKLVTAKFHGQGTQLGASVQVDKGTHTNKPPHPKTAPAYRKDEKPAAKKPELRPSLEHDGPSALCNQDGCSKRRVTWGGRDSAYCPEHGGLSKDELTKVSPPGRKEEVEKLKAKGLPASEAFGIAWKQQNAEAKKGEMSPNKPKGAAPCICTAYQFPHRHKSGKCGAGK